MNRKLITLMLILTSFVAANVHAQTQRTGSDVARVMQQLQQVSADKARLQTENDALKKQLEELKTKASKAGADQAVVQQQKRELETSKAQQKESADELEKLRDKMQELIGKFRETATQLQAAESDREQLKASIASRERDYKVCVDRNAGMYFLSDEILRRLEDRSLLNHVSEKEPFTRISRTRLENLVDDYRDRIEELRVSRKTAATH